MSATMDVNRPVSTLLVRSQKVIHNGLSDPEYFFVKGPTRPKAGPSEGLGQESDVVHLPRRRRG